MNPLIITALIKGAVEIFTNKEAFKENLKSKSTAAAAAIASAATVGSATGALDENEQLAAAITTIILFLLRKAKV
jgi:hypothetical protein